MWVSVSERERERERVMEDPHPPKKKKRNVVVVGLKLRPGSRELLTWALAKFAAPGDRVIALHIAMQTLSPPSLSGANAQLTLQRQLNSAFDSVIGVYNKFCSAKQIDLQLKVISSASSLRRTLIDQSKHYNASRLILGTSGTELPTTDSSVDLANYCVKHLPSTCSVLVTQHGMVVYEQAGALASGDKSKGRNLTSQPIMQCCDAKKNPSVNYCSCYQSNRSVGFSHHMLHPYKYVPPQVQGLQMCNVELKKLIPMPSSSTSRAKHQVLFNKGFNTSMPIQKCALVSGPLEDHSAPEKKSSKHCLQKGAESKWSLQKCTTMPSFSPEWPLTSSGWNSVKPCVQKVFSEATSSCSELESSLMEAGLQARNDMEAKGASSAISKGWPLLHQTLTAAGKSKTPFAEARKMSVVEWVLQLPERPKHLVEQHSDPISHDWSLHSAIRDRQVCDDVSDAQAKQQEVEGVLFNKVEETLLEKCYRICKSKTCIVFCIADLETATNSFSKDNLVGKGGCSQVYRGVLSDGRVVAVKCLDISPASGIEDEFFTELEIVSGLQHRHVIDLLGYCIDDNKQRYLLVYNYASKGNLEQKLHHSDDIAVLLWSARHKIAIGIGEALEYLHNSVQPVIHRDVKSSNILLQSDLSPQLADFGLSKRTSTISAFITCDDVVGTFGYIAPEYFMFGKVSPKTDVYSFGVVLLELVSGKPPNESVRHHGQGNLILWAKPLLDDEATYGEVVDRRLGNEYDEDQLRNMLMAASLCLQHSPHARPSMSKVLKVLRGEQADMRIRQDSLCKRNDEFCYVLPVHGDHDIRRHLAMALYGLEEDMSSQSGLDTNICHSNPNKLIEEYLRHRYSRSNSFD